VKPETLLWAGFAVAFAVFSMQSAMRAKRLHVEDIDRGFSDMNASYQELKRGIAQADRVSNCASAV